MRSFVDPQSRQPRRHLCDASAGCRCEGAGCRYGSRCSSRRSSRPGFSLIELVIVVVIIGIIAAIAIPRMSRGSAAAADASLVQNLSTLRNSVDLYAQEHNGQYPQGTGAQVANLLLQYSDAAGANTSSTKDTGSNQVIYGPYLRNVPAITVGSSKGSNGIAVSNTSGVAAAGGPGIAWLYNSVDGTFQAYTGTTTTDSAGRLYSSY